jgi:GT2 family glycosyltransferase
LTADNVRVIVIIPVYGNWDDTLQCLTALAAQNTTEFEVLIADDGSPTPPPAAILEFAFAHYRRHENVGYGANCNRAAKEAIALGATHLLLLNSDTSFGNSFIQKWIARAAEMPDAISSPQIYWLRYPTRIWSSGGKLTVLTPYVRFRAAFTRVTEVDVVTGCALFIPLSAWSDLNGFDPRYRMYFEDFDFTLRAKEKGIKTFVLPDRELYVWHHVSRSFAGPNVWKKNYFFLTSSLLFIRSRYCGIRKPLCLALGGAHLCLTTLLSLPQLPAPRLLWAAMTRGFSAD